MSGRSFIFNAGSHFFDQSSVGGIHCGQLILGKISKICDTRCQKAEMHQIRFLLGQSLNPTGGAYSTPPDWGDSLAVFKGPTLRERGREQKGEEKRGEGCPSSNGESWSGSGGGERRRARRRTWVRASRHFFFHFKQCLIHCVQKKTPTHIFFHISMDYLWI